MGHDERAYADRVLHRCQTVDCCGAPEDRRPRPKQGFEVYTVLGDGVQRTVLVTSDPLVALAVLAAERAKYKGWHNHAHGVVDPDDEERGDIEDQLEEAEYRLEQEAEEADPRCQSYIQRGGSFALVRCALAKAHSGRCAESL